DLDILFLGVAEQDKPRNVLLINNGPSGFVQRPLNLPSIGRPEAVAIADADGDGFLDLFVGQRVDGDTSRLSGCLLLNDRHGSLVESDVRFAGLHDVVGAEWVDIDRDGDPDLYTSGSSAGDNHLWINDGTGRFQAGQTGERIADAASGSPGEGAGGDWG